MIANWKHLLDTVTKIEVLLLVFYLVTVKNSISIWNLLVGGDISDNILALRGRISANYYLSA